MTCEICGNLVEACECEKESDESIDFGDDERVWGYDGDCL